MKQGKYKPTIKRAAGGIRLGRKWSGPRGRSLCGTGKNLARLAWDRGRNA